MSTNELSQQPENLQSNDILTDVLDETILVAMTNENRSFCLQTENFLVQFMKSPKQKEILLDLDKFKRKIVHKICERFNIMREYVNLKPNETGDITISKCESSFIPESNLTELMKRRELEKGKNVTDQSKKKIFQRNSANPKECISNQRAGNQPFTSTEEEFEIQKKNEEYEKAKKRILTGKNTNMNPEQPVERNKPNKLENRQTSNNEASYDPDYNRNINRPIQPPVYQQQPMIPTPVMMPQNMGYNQGFGFQQQGNVPQNFMKFPNNNNPGYQGFGGNNLMNEFSFQNQGIQQQPPPMNPLFNQLGYSNYGMFQNIAPPMNNQLNLGILPQQQQPQQIHQPVFLNNNNFQTSPLNPYGDIKRNPNIVIQNQNTLNDKKKVIAKEQPKVNAEKILKEEDFPTLEQANKH